MCFLLLWVLAAVGIHEVTPLAPSGPLPHLFLLKSFEIFQSWSENLKNSFLSCSYLNMFYSTCYGIHCDCRTSYICLCILWSSMYFLLWSEWKTTDAKGPPATQPPEHLCHRLSSVLVTRCSESAAHIRQVNFSSIFQCFCCCLFRLTWFYRQVERVEIL